MAIVKLDGFECQRCGHRWMSRIIKQGNDELPTICPGCKSPYWMKPKNQLDKQRFNDATHNHANRGLERFV